MKGTSSLLGQSSSNSDTLGPRTEGSSSSTAPQDNVGTEDKVEYIPMAQDMVYFDLLPQRIKNWMMYETAKPFSATSVYDTYLKANKSVEVFLRAVAAHTVRPVSRVRQTYKR